MPTLHKLQDLFDVFIHGEAHHTQAVDFIMHFFHSVQSVLRERRDSNTVKIHYTINRLVTIYTWYISFVNDYI